MTTMTAEREDVLSTNDEYDLSGDSAVEIVTGTWTVQSIEEETSDSPKGSGKYVAIEFANDDWYAPITMRFFTSYESKIGKDVEWVKKQRGQLKNVLKAFTGQTHLAEALNSDSENYIVGKSATATTKDGGDGFAVLGRFKKLAE